MSAASTLPWDTAAHLPWQMFKSPVEQWATLPSFVVGEYLVIALAITGLVHACRAGRGNLVIWLAALIAGTANDMIFMALPLVDNFWQAQATIMITPRLPLYIPCMYVLFLYYPTVAARRLGLSAFSTAAVAGLAACLFYAPYDIVGAKFLWWSWHDTDAPIAARLLGAPVSSSLWVLTFAGSFAWLLRGVPRGVLSASQFPVSRLLRHLGLVAAFTTLVMMVQMTVLQQVSGGTPGYLSLAAGLVLYAGIAVRGLWAGQRGAGETAGTLAERIQGSALPLDPLGRNATLAWFTTMAIIMAIFSPQSHKSLGVHQVPGPCGIEVADVTGQIRHEFLCVSDFDEDYTFACTTSPEDGSQWYAICGRGHSSFALWMGGIGLLTALGALLFSRMFGVRRQNYE